jgi:hypothetical protein
MTGSHNVDQKENGGGGGGDQKSHARRNIADNTKLKDNFMKELRIEWDRKFPLNDNT